MTTLVKMYFGSRLYGTATENSDTDYRGVYLPRAQSVLLGRVKHTLTENTKTDTTHKNSAQDVDSQVYSLQYFIDLACQGETAALDMLHAPRESLLQSSSIWHDLQANRGRFYTRNLKSFVHYARNQAAKYGVRGSRLSDCGRVLDFLKSVPAKSARIGEFWDDLPEGEHIAKKADPSQANVGLYLVCGRAVQSTCRVDKTIPIFEKYYENYGARAKLAEKNEGVDWKAVSHALRAAFQVREILTTGDLVFPLKNADYLRRVKLGEFTYPEVGARLEQEIDEVGTLIATSTLPEKVDREFWDAFVLNCYGVKGDWL